MQSKEFELWKKKMSLAGKEKRIPVSGQFELTPRCNFDCKMCYIHNQNSNTLKSRELTTQQWKGIFDEACEAGMLFATVTGGECLLRDDFRELYLYLWSKGVLITILTNGALVTDDLVEFFIKHRPDKIQITLYGSSEEGYLAVTGHRGFGRVVENIRKLQDAGIHVVVKETASKYSADDYIETIKCIRQNGFKLALSQIGLIPKRDDPTEDSYNLSMDEAVQLSIQRAELIKKLTPVSETPEPCGDCNVAPSGLTCNAGNGLAYVTWEGKMYPCASVMVGDGYSLLEMSFAEAWEKTKTAAEQVVMGMECVGCPYDKLCPKCPALRLKDLQSGHCNPEVCEMTRRLVAAGVLKLKKSE